MPGFAVKVTVSMRSGVTAEDARVHSHPIRSAHSGSPRHRQQTQLQAALYPGRLHLAAQALGVGAAGSTSFDDELVEFFSPRAADASYIFVTEFGARHRRS
jgi:hypothetical protein